MCPGGFFNFGLTVCAEDGRLGGACAVRVGKRPFATERLQRPKGYAMLELPTGKHPEEKTEISSMKKFLSILMVCALMLGLFACASTNEDTTTTADPATTETTAAPTEQPTEPVVDDDAPAYAASFRPAIFRYGMTNRIVKDCRVGRTRPPRNDKIDGFCGKTERF